MEAEGIWRKLPDWSRVEPLILTARLGLAAFVRAVVGVFTICLVTPRIGRMGCIDAGDATPGIFPFRLGEQSVRLARHAREPFGVGFCLIPRHVDHWSALLSKASVARWPTITTPHRDASLPFVPGDLEFSNRKRPVDLDLVARILVAAALAFG